jgi:uncharacterized protein (DUF1810 family)
MSAYLEQEVLGPRLKECASVLLQLETGDIEHIMGFPDNLKLKSSMTLFSTVSPSETVFQDVLDRYFGGESDQKTLAFLTRKETNPSNEHRGEQEPGHKSARQANSG